MRFEGLFEQSARPLRRWRDFNSRSTRTELVGFWLLVAIVRYCLATAALAVGGLEALQVADWSLALLLIVPTAALFARRLHDSGRSAAWLLLLLPGIVNSLRVEAEWLAGRGLATDPRWWDLALALPGAALFVLLLWNDDPEPNRYGPNPRYDEVPDDPQPA